MQILLKTGDTLSVVPFTLADTALLHTYLAQLSTLTRSRFAPHGTNEADIITAYAYPAASLGYLGFINNTQLIAYILVKIGYLQHDASRLCSYGLSLDPLTDATIAPSVADAWQGYGIGTAMMKAVIQDLKQKGIKRLLLWGGVQAENEKAIQLYQRMGFVVAGSFEHNGTNLDMFLSLS